MVLPEGIDLALLGVAQGVDPPKGQQTWADRGPTTRRRQRKVAEGSRVPVANDVTGVTSVEHRRLCRAELVRQLYVGRFLCCLGYQGDNNEGIAYWGYGLMFIVDYADELKAVCGINLYKHPWLSQTARFLMYGNHAIQ